MSHMVQYAPVNHSITNMPVSHFPNLAYYAADYMHVVHSDHRQSLELISTLYSNKSWRNSSALCMLEKGGERICLDPISTLYANIS